MDVLLAQKPVAAAAWGPRKDDPATGGAPLTTTTTSSIGTPGKRRAPQKGKTARAFGTPVHTNNASQSPRPQPSPWRSTHKQTPKANAKLKNSKLPATAGSPATRRASPEVKQQQQQQQQQKGRRAHASPAIALWGRPPVSTDTPPTAWGGQSARSTPRAKAAVVHSALELTSPKRSSWESQRAFTTIEGAKRTLLNTPNGSRRLTYQADFLMQFSALCVESPGKLHGDVCLPRRDDGAPGKELMDADAVMELFADEEDAAADKERRATEGRSKVSRDVAQHLRPATAPEAQPLLHATTTPLKNAHTHMASRIDTPMPAGGLFRLPAGPAGTPARAATAPPTPKIKQRETDEARIAARSKQISIGMNTPSYRRWARLRDRQVAIPSDSTANNKPLVCPKTPDKLQVCSKRAWDSQVRQWRRSLHERHDDMEDSDDEEIGEGGEVLFPSDTAGQ